MLRVPVVPYLHHGAVQVPLRPLLPASSEVSSISSALVPAWTPLVFSPSNSQAEHTNVAPVHSGVYSPSVIDISIDHPSYEQSSGPDPTPSVATVGRADNDTDTQMKGRKPAITAAGTFFALFTYAQIYQNVIFPRLTPPSEQLEEKGWVNSSRSWLDRRVCNWFGLCGIAHLNQAHWTTEGGANISEPTKAGNKERTSVDLSEFLESARALPKNWTEQELKDREVPQYVLDHAPLIHLYSGEEYWPCDIEEHLFHTTPHLNYTPLQAVDDHPTLENLHELNKWGRFVYLQSDDNVEDYPEWLGGKSNIPGTPDDSDPDEDLEAGGHYEEDKDGEKSSWWNVGIGDTKERGGIRSSGIVNSRVPTPTAIPTNTPEGEELVDVGDEPWQSELRRTLKKRGKKVVGGRSDAPATLVVVPKENGVVDAFWFFFYSYNLGNSVFNVRFGNHVGDWEHTTVRFQDGVPKAVFFSEHSFGEAYTWDAVEKSGKRPVGFSATGTHAMYATSGVHPYILPGGILHDVTDRGPLWDPTLNLYAYTYDYRRDDLKSSNLTPRAPLGFFYFMGHWGDKFYPLSDPRQYRFLGQYHYVNGPLGPRFKNLGRKEICQGNGECVLKKWIGDKKARPHVKRYPLVGRGEEMSEEDMHRFGVKDIA
ncbi:Vacuolar protein sorting-associated protein 62 [Paraconiothyrium brasiliense]|uniref:Vacuolar protein sorting-associated protein 62 n=1 Tax=Paraconiothyrium brasiliense TaxID=300254 RepID=A0ABR3QT45_9PLEO